MRVICTDNYSRSGCTPGYDERFIAFDIPNEDHARALAKHMNDKEPLDSCDYYRAVPDTYVLVKYDAEYVHMGSSNTALSKCPRCGYSLRFTASILPRIECMNYNCDYHEYVRIEGSAL